MKKYTLFSILFIALLTLYVYMEENSTTTFNFLGADITLSNAVWIAIFLGLFYIFSLIFFSVLHIREFMFRKNIQKDIQILISNIKNAILYKPLSQKKVKQLKDCDNFVKTIEGLNIKPVKIEKFEFLEDIARLLNGEVVEIGKYKLKEDNPWFVMNIKNRLKKDEKFAREVLKKYKNEELKKEAFKIYAKNASISEILKYDYKVDVDIILAHIDKEDVKFLFNKADLTPLDEIKIARVLYGKFDPDKELEIVESLKWASAYLAFKYEHIEKAKEIIEENDLRFFEYFLKLRLSGEKADIDEYIDSRI